MKKSRGNLPTSQGIIAKLTRKVTRESAPIHRRKGMSALQFDNSIIIFNQPRSAPFCPAAKMRGLTAEEIPGEQIGGPPAE